jgi:methylthioribose-1-phosphate isomerase
MPSKGRESLLFWPVTWKGQACYVLDETRIPEVAWIQISSAVDAVKVIRQMKTRAFGQFLVVLSAFLLELNRAVDLSQTQLLVRLKKCADRLNASRPTFPFAEVTGLVIHWAESAAAAGGDVRIHVRRAVEGYLKGVREKRLARVRDIAQVMKNGDTVLTHCHVSGELAMAFGEAARHGKNVQFFATETRPYFQGARLTCWELKRMGADVTLIADNAVGTVMADGLINKVIVGSDRSCANGDFANKVGTYQIAVLARHFGIPLYVLTQPSDRISCGKDIPIEIREEKEILTFEGKRIYPSGTRAFYPGFDVVPRELAAQAIPLQVHER